MALSCAASASSGLVVDFGCMVKPLHAGRAASAGMEAAFYSARDMTASTAALEAANGFLTAFFSSGAPRTNAGMEAFGQQNRWRLDADYPSVKRYPVCYAGHRLIDAALSVRNRLTPGPQEHVAD